MDDRAFDRLAKSVSSPATRRAALTALLSAFVLAGGDATARPEDGGKARGERGGKDQGRDRKRCNPKPDAAVCKGKCGPVKNNCGKRIDCGPCPCGEDCGDCGRCDELTGRCVADGSKDGSCCGNGSGVCGGGSCGRCGGGQRCQAGACVCDGQSCSGCCDGHACRPGTIAAACGPAGGTCAVCAAGQGCAAGACVDLDCGQGGACLVFATRSLHLGNLGGLAGADAICQSRAKEAGLPGTYMAWLSDSTGSPATRFHRSTGPYRRVDGVTVANDWADLTDGSLAAPISRTAGGEAVPSDSNRYAWTNTSTSGTAIDEWDCADWTSSDSGIGAGREGSVLVTHGWWTATGGAECGNSRRLYCFQQS